MIYKIVAILMIVGLASAHVIADRPSDLIALKEKPGIVALSGTDFDKIFSNPSMQLAPLGLPPRGYATDLRINRAFTLEAQMNWSDQEPAPLTPVKENPS